MPFESKSSSTRLPFKRKRFDSIQKDIDSPKKIKKNMTDVIAKIVYERHQGNVATYYVDPTSTTIHPFYNNIRRDVASNYGPLHKLGILGI
jgi:hypothetical protein